MFPDATLADLYDPDLMPPALHKAHTTLDKAVDRLYRKKGFASERERVEHLFMLYEKLVGLLEAAANAKVKTVRKKAPGPPLPLRERMSRSDRRGVIFQPPQNHPSLSPKMATSLPQGERMKSRRL